MENNNQLSKKEINFKYNALQNCKNISKKNKKLPKDQKALKAENKILQSLLMPS